MPSHRMRGSGGSHKHCHGNRWSRRARLYRDVADLSKFRVIAHALHLHFPRCFPRKETAGREGYWMRRLLLRCRPAKSASATANRPEAKSCSCYRSESQVDRPAAAGGSYCLLPDSSSATRGPLPRVERRSDRGRIRRDDGRCRSNVDGFADLSDFELHVHTPRVCRASNSK